MSFIETIINSDTPSALFDDYSTKIKELFSLKNSIKHMRGADVGKLDTEAAS